MKRSRSLLDLQTLDLRRDEAVARLGRVVAGLRGSPALVRARRACAEAEAELAELDRGLRTDQLERRSVQDHVAAEEQKLYGGRVTVPRELQNLQREVTALKRRLSELDDVLLEGMLARDAAAARLAAARAELSDLEVDSLVEAEALQREKSDLARRVRALDAERATLVSTVDDAARALYDRLRQRKDGRAVAPIQGEHCGGCGIQLPRQTLEHARNGPDLATCAGCGRILHA